MPNPHEQVRRALRRQRSGDDRQRNFDNAMASVPASMLTAKDLAEIVNDALREQRRQILAHVGRMIEMALMKERHAPPDTREKNLHQRLVIAESEIRQLRHKGLKQ